MPLRDVTKPLDEAPERASMAAGHGCPQGGSDRSGMGNLA